MSCTQEELMLVMQKLLHERQRVKTLERSLGDKNSGGKQQASAVPTQAEKEPQNRVTAEIKAVEATPAMVIPSVSDAYEKQIAVLKNVIKDLGEKLQTASQQSPQPPLPVALTAATASTATPDEQFTQLRQNLYQAQQEARTTKERMAAAEADRERLREMRDTLQLKLQEQNTHLQNIKLQSAKVQNEELAKVELVKKEAADYQAKVFELEKLLEQERHQLSIISRQKKEPSELIDKKELIEEQKKRERAEQELDDIKLLFVEMRTRNKEHEAKIASLLIEKQNALQHLQEQELLHTHDGTALIEVKQKIDVLEKTIEEHSEEGKRLTQELIKKEHRIQQLDKELQDEQHQLRETRALESEQKGQIALLEQHLARRIKECAILTQRHEEETQELQIKETKLNSATSELNQLKLRDEEMRLMLSQQIADLEQETFSLQELVQHQAREINQLKKLEERYLLLDKLFGQCDHIMTRRTASAEARQETRLQKIAMRKEPQQPIINSNTLFSHSKEVSARRHDLFE